MKLLHVIPLAVLAACSTTPTEPPAADGGQGASPAARTGAAPRSAAAPAPALQSRGAGPNGRSIYYEYDKSDIRPESRSLIEANAKYLLAHPELKIRVEGNADERGSAEYNLALGQRRAESVARMMKLLGVADGRIEAVSLGKEKPKRTGHDETSWQENRRSDIVY
jgi:peptidoglycan-associated lipoprotein